MKSDTLFIGSLLMLIIALILRGQFDFVVGFVFLIASAATMAISVFMVIWENK